MENFENPDHPGNGPMHHTGEPCIREGCDKPAGTAWSPYWCFEHNVERMKFIDGQFDFLKALFEIEEEL